MTVVAAVADGGRELSPQLITVILTRSIWMSNQIATSQQKPKRKKNLPITTPVFCHWLF